MSESPTIGGSAAIADVASASTGVCPDPTESPDVSAILDGAIRSALAGDLPAAQAAFAQGRRLGTESAALNERWLSARMGDPPDRRPAVIDIAIDSLPVYGFMHIATVNHWDRIVAEQFQRLRDSGLWDKTRRLFVSLVGPQASQCRFVDERVEVVHVEDALEAAEFPIMRRIHDFCRKTPCLVYYIHTKGVTVVSPFADDWRRMMEHFIIDRHADCRALLAHHDVCGVNWIERPWPHFSGNFWWATSQHIARLPSVDALELGSMSQQVFTHKDRHKAERWIGSHGDVRAACLHWSGVDHYLELYPSDRYRSAARTAVAPTNQNAPVNHGGPPPSPRSGEEDWSERDSNHRQLSVEPALSDDIARSNDPPVYGFMHVCMTGQWRSIVDEQILKMQASGLWDRCERLYVGVVGGAADQFPHLGDKVVVSRESPNVEAGELITLQLLEDHCRRHDGLVFYVHTKGAVHAGMGQTQWRHAMEHFALVRFRACIKTLEDHDACGIYWHQGHWCRMFRGNFWWARADYVRTLPPVTNLAPLPDLEPQARNVCERWIGENPAVRAASFFNSDVDHYANQPLPRSAYARLREVVPDHRWISGSWSPFDNRVQDLLEPVDPLRHIVQLGVGDGGSLFSLASAAPGASVIAVRGRRTDRDAASSEAAQWIARHRSTFPNLMIAEDAPTAPDHLNPNAGEPSSIDVGQVSNLSIDVLYLHGMTTHEEIAAAFAEWEPRVRTGGCVLVDGVRSFPDDIGRFVRNLRGRQAVIDQGIGLAAWYKP